MIRTKAKSLFTAIAALLFVLPVAGEEKSLDGKWTLDFWPQDGEAVVSPETFAKVSRKTIDATVPGNVELDLLAAGLIEDPELGSNVYKLRPYEGYGWRYSRKFETPKHGPEDAVVLDFEGIDCYAEIFVNGKHVGSADNMLIAHEFDVTKAVKPAGAQNLVEVFIRSSVEEGRKYLTTTTGYQFAQVEAIHTRRAPHTYGWDIMPRLVSAGLWKSVSVRVDKPVRIRDINWITQRISGTNATLFLDYNVALPVKYQESGYFLRYTLSREGKETISDGTALYSHAGRLWINVSDVDLWWPRGYGEAALYDAEIKIYDPQGNVIDTDSKRIGIRTVKLDYTEINTPEEPGEFAFIVNGVKIYSRGSNWTPMDALHSRDPQHLEETFELVKDLNCNMIRCWGGNVYESDEFYDLCDENGVMVWQDFAMGCSVYSQSLDFQLALEKEIQSVVLRLRNHPSIALWAGNNEDDQTLAFGTLGPFRPDPNKDVVSRETIPHVLFEYDPTRTYLPSSPFLSERLIKEYYSNTALPEDHIWGPRGYYKDQFYLSQTCLFASEIGYHGMPSRESLEKMFPAESVYPWEEGSDFRWNSDWLTKAVRIFKEHGYCPDRNNLMINQVNKLFGEVPTDLDDFIFASQSVQAEAMKYFVEKFRGHKFAPNTGMLWWNIRDGWPLISDAVTDFYFNKKLAYHFLKNSQRTLCAVMNDPDKGKRSSLVVVNDSFENYSGTIKVTDVATGKVLYKGKFKVGSNDRSIVRKIRAPKGQGILLIECEVNGGESFRNHYLYGTATFDLKTYRELLEKTEIYPIK